MAVQSFNLSVDFLNNLEKPIIYFAKKDNTFLGAVSIYDDLSFTFNLNAYQTASFKIYRDINGKKYEHYDNSQKKFFGAVTQAIEKEYGTAGEELSRMKTEEEK